MRLDSRALTLYFHWNQWLHGAYKIGDSVGETTLEAMYLQIYTRIICPQSVLIYGRLVDFMAYQPL